MLLFYLGLLDTEEEKSKFECIYNQYRRLMFYAANQILKDPELAEDAVHDAFIRLVKYISNIEDPYCHKTKALVVIITENISKDIYVKRKRENIIDFNDEEKIPVFHTETFDEYEDNEILDKIKELPSIYRDVMMLKYIHDYSDKEIAKVFDISPAAVRKRNERARNKLALLLKEEG